MDQITNIAIKVGELQQQSSSAFLQSWIAIAVAGVGFLGTVIAALITADISRKLHQKQKEHEKQWAYTNRRSLLIDQAIEICARILYNRPLIITNNDQGAIANLYGLQKDALVVESQLVVYATLELAKAFSEFKDYILGIPNDEFLRRWIEINNRGHEYLKLCRGSLGNDITENFEDFAKNLKVNQPSNQEIRLASATTMGTIAIHQHE